MDIFSSISDYGKICGIGKNIISHVARHSNYLSQLKTSNLQERNS
jgi:hypothetical protein